MGYIETDRNCRFPRIRAGFNNNMGYIETLQDCLIFVVLPGLITIWDILKHDILEVIGKPRIGLITIWDILKHPLLCLCSSSHKFNNNMGYIETSCCI